MDGNKDVDVVVGFEVGNNEYDNVDYDDTYPYAYACWRGPEWEWEWEWEICMAACFGPLNGKPTCMGKQDPTGKKTAPVTGYPLAS